jgi:hypothetical protein
MEKVFIGKVKEKTFSNGGSIITLGLSPEDKAKIAGADWTNIDIKKSAKGNWYAEISQFKPQEQAPGRAYQQADKAHYKEMNPPISEQVDDLPF